MSDDEFAYAHDPRLLWYLRGERVEGDDPPPAERIRILRAETARLERAEVDYAADSFAGGAKTVRYCPGIGAPGIEARSVAEIEGAQGRAHGRPACGSD